MKNGMNLSLYHLLGYTFKIVCKHNLNPVGKASFITMNIDVHTIYIIKIHYYFYAANYVVDVA